MKGGGGGACLKGGLFIRIAPPGILAFEDPRWSSCDEVNSGFQSGAISHKSQAALLLVVGVLFELGDFESNLVKQLAAVAPSLQV